jgi:hypothetical protein
MEINHEIHEKHEMAKTGEIVLFDRVLVILERARINVVRSVNSNMVTAYWLIGREIVHAVQGGEERAEYGKQVVEELSRRLSEKFGKGFSAPTLWNFRQFYLVFENRLEILSPVGRESADNEKLFLTGSELEKSKKPGSVGNVLPKGFSPSSPGHTTAP